MPFFAFRWRFSPDAIKALTEKPQNREAAARQVIEGYGGKLHHYYFMLGDYDGLGIVEFPDNVSAAAASMRITSTGSFTCFETHPLMTAEEAKHAMEKVGKGSVTYRPPTA